MRAKRVGRSLVSAITQTPASGPFGPVTTPPISVAPILTPGGACWADSCAGAAASKAAASTIGAAFRRNLPLILMVNAPLHRCSIGMPAIEAGPFVARLIAQDGVPQQAWDDKAAFNRHRQRMPAAPERCPSGGGSGPIHAPIAI